MPLLPQFTKGLTGIVQVLRDRPEQYPITPSVKPMDKAAIQACVEKHYRRYRDPIADILRRHDDEVVFNALLNVVVIGGVPLMGGPGLADYLEELVAHAAMTPEEKAEELLRGCVFGFLDAGMEVRGRDPRDGSIHDIRELLSDEQMVSMIRAGLPQEPAIRDASDDGLRAMVRRWRADPKPEWSEDD